MYIFEAGMQPVSRFETTHYHTNSDVCLYDAFTGRIEVHRIV